jgi:hypothetical protein
MFFKKALPQGEAFFFKVLVCSQSGQYTVPITYVFARLSTFKPLLPPVFHPLARKDDKGDKMLSQVPKPKLEGKVLPCIKRLTNLYLQTRSSCKRQAIKTVSHCRGLCDENLIFNSTSAEAWGQRRRPDLTRGTVMPSKTATAYCRAFCLIFR